MRNCRSVLFSSILVMILCVLSGCGAQPEAAPEASVAKDDLTNSLPAEALTPPAEQYEPVDGDWLVERLRAEMPHLNPYTSSDAYASSISSQIFEGLLDRSNETLEMLPCLAESWEMSDDHLSYTFKLRSGVQFSDGVPFTAADVLFSFNKMRDPKTDAPHLQNYYKDVEKCEIVDESTVRFICSKPYYRHIVMLGGMEIIPEHIYGKGDFNTHPNNRKPIGTGPYVLEKWETAQSLILVRNENYWGEKPHLLRREVKIITDENAAFQVLARGDLDTMTIRPEDWVTRASSKKFEAKFNKLTYSAPQYSYVGWNSRKPQFEDKMVRRAMTMLLDRELIRETIYEGLAVVVTGNFMPGMPEQSPNVEAWPYDPARAAELLDASGWVDSDGDGVRDKDGLPFSFEMLISNSSTVSEKVSTILQEELKRVGIKMRIKMLEWATMAESVDKRKFDATMMGWSMPPDPDPFQVWHSTQAEGGSNYVGFVNAEADKLVEDARISFDKAERVKLYNRFHEIVHEEQPYTFMFSPLVLLAVDKRIHGVVMYPYGPDSIEWFVPTDLQRYK